MEVYTIKVGPNITNCYLIEDEKKSYLIDPGEDGEKILSIIQEKELKLDKIILTHGHFDHIGGVKFLRERTGVEVYIHPEDKEYLLDGKKNLSYLTGEVIELLPVDGFLNEGDFFAKFRVIHTPGHTPGGISLYSVEDNLLFSGDTIFNNGYGRTDFPGGDLETLINSINKLLKLPDETIVYPGHGPTTTIREFKRYMS